MWEKAKTLQKIWAVVLLFAFPLAAGEWAVLAAEVPPQIIDYNRDIRPLLSDRCFACHGPDANHREAGLRLDVEESAKEWVIDTADPAASEFLVRIDSDDPSIVMPPPDSGKELTPEERSLLRRWIEQGADYELAWAYRQPQWHAPPSTETDHWSESPLDDYILARLEAADVTPAPRPPKSKLLRRLSFDLTGLPPTPAEIKAFTADQSPAAYVRHVDRLLASPAFGERLAIYWLDLVRYADTVGYHGDQDHNISPYRDYVINAFNDGLPLDQFTREQLAGDLLPDPSEEQLIATGYNRMLQTSHEGGVQPKEYLAIYAADRVRNVSAVWLGGTLGCAQCHDHKFDPYTTEDFYSFAAFFADIDEAQHFTEGSNSLPTARPPEMRVLRRVERQRWQQLEAERDQLLSRIESAEGEVKQRLQQRIEAIEQERKRIRESGRLTMITKSIEPRTMRVLPRGNWLDESGPIVEPHVPRFFGPLQPAAERASRLDLADWLVDPEDGVGLLTARVMANRLWYLMMGTGLSRSLDDFGGQGEPPSHPQLLDRLALEFVASDWDVKHLIREIVLSETYRQSSEVSPAARKRDPYNQLFGRQSAYRLPAEMIRDNALAVSGLLVREMGGPSIRPYQPAGYYRHLNFPPRRYFPDEDENQWRRGVYVHWQRQFLHPTFKAMDAPTREECTAARPRSNTPLEALALLNDDSFVEAARMFAARICQHSEPATDRERIDVAFQLALSRRAEAAERKVLLELLAAERAGYANSPEAAAELLQVGHAPLDDHGNQAELAAWTQVCRTILNLHETVWRP